MDITKFRKWTKEQGLKTSHSIIYLMGKIINGIPEFKTRLLEDGRIVEYEKVDPVFAVALPGRQFSSTSVPFDYNPKAFFKNILEKIHELEATNGGKMHSLSDMDVFRTTCLPDIDFTSASFANKNSKDTRPLIAWGKYTEEEDKKIKMAVTLRFHHGIVDGEHASTFYKELQEDFNTPEHYLTSSN